ncbi:MAG: TetR/AcrR family transcriptional regulator [Actinomycetota bacterium]
MSERNEDVTDRRGQIINSAVGMMTSHGIAGATTARIAADVGISEPALYRHFENKREILLAALAQIGAQLIAHTTSAAAGAAGEVERIRLMSAAFYDFVMSHPEETRVLFDAVSAARDEEMRRALNQQFAGLLGIIEAVVAGGVESGSLRADLDVPLAAWEIFSLGITLYFASILGFSEILTREKALAAVDRLLDSMVNDTTDERRKGI